MLYQEILHHSWMFYCRFWQEILRESVMSRWMISENHSCTLTGQKTSDWSRRSSRRALSRLATASGMISRFHFKLSSESCWFYTLVHILRSPTLFCFKHTCNYSMHSLKIYLDCIKVWYIYKWWLKILFYFYIYELLLYYTGKLCCLIVDLYVVSFVIQKSFGK